MCSQLGLASLPLYFSPPCDRRHGREVKAHVTDPSNWIETDKDATEHESTALCTDGTPLTARGANRPSPLSAQNDVQYVETTRHRRPPPRYRVKHPHHQTVLLRQQYGRESELSRRGVETVWTTSRLLLPFQQVPGNLDHTRAHDRCLGLAQTLGQIAKETVLGPIQLDDADRCSPVDFCFGHSPYPTFTLWDNFTRMAKLPPKIKGHRRVL